MRRTIYSIPLILILLIFPLLSGCNKHPSTENMKPLSPKQELVAKNALIQQDVTRTQQLMEIQFSEDARTFLRRHQNETFEQQTKSMHKFLQDHPSIRFVKIENTKTNKIMLSGTQSESQKNIEWMNPYVKSMQHGTTEAVRHQNKTYIILSVHSGPYHLTGLVHPKMLDHLLMRQQKELRTISYPNKPHWQVESIDSRTQKKVHPSNAEQNEGKSHYHIRQVVVKFKHKLTPSELVQIQDAIGATETKTLDHTYIFESNTRSMHDLKAYFKSNWDLVYIEPHYLYTTNTIEKSFRPNDSLYSRYQWDLPALSTVQGWQISKGSQKTKVAVVDTGVDLTHPDLQKNIVKGYNVISGNDIPDDDVGHGTHVAGVISAVVNNNVGIAGMTWYDKIMPVKVLDHSGAGTTYSVSQGIIWATDHGAKVINLSLGNYADAQFLHEAIRYAYKHDVVIIAASGNDNTERPGYPAAYPEVFAVGAINPYGQRASFSNYGDYIDVVAPGVNIASTYYHHMYAALSGTSMATPHVAALAALIRSKNPKLTNEQVMNIMRRTARDLGPKGKDKYYGYGLIDVNHALQATEKKEHPLFVWSAWIKKQLKKAFGTKALA